MSIATFRSTIATGAPLAGTFMKTPSVDILEVLILSGLDFVCLDCEHAPFDRQTLSACLAVARARDFPVLIRVPAATPDQIGAALDLGAVGIVVPHVTDASTAAAVARAARFGHGGRGYAGSTRWAVFGTRAMKDVLRQSIDETIVIAQIEDPEAVELADGIAGVDGIDGVFVGPADLAVCFGKDDPSDPMVLDAMRKTGRAAKAHNKAFMTFAGSAAAGPDLHDMGITMFFVASEHAFMLRGATAEADMLHKLA